MSEEEILQRIYELMEKHVGYQNKITSRRVADELVFDAGVSMVRVRNLILKMMKRFNLPLAAGGAGYYVPLEEEQDRVMNYIKSLQRRAQKNQYRAFLVDKLFNEYYGHPVELAPDLFEDEEDPDAIDDDIEEDEDG